MVEQRALLWDVQGSRLVIKGVLEAATGIRIGGSADEFGPVESDLPVIRDSKGHPFIPGSSLRGVVRAHVERICRTLEPMTPGLAKPWHGRGACNPLSNTEACVTKQVIESLSRSERSDPATRAEMIWEHSCRVCRLFGSPWLASRVRIPDLYARDGSTVAIEVRDGVSIDRDKEIVANKYDFEVVPRGSQFVFEMTADNLSDKEAGLVFLGLRALQSGQVLLGGFKGRGLGRVELRDLEVRALTTLERSDKASVASWVSFFTRGEMPLLSPEEMDECIERAIEDLSNGGEADA